MIQTIFLNSAYRVVFLGLCLKTIEYFIELIYQRLWECDCTNIGNMIFIENEPTGGDRARSRMYKIQKVKSTTGELVGWKRRGLKMVKAEGWTNSGRSNVSKVSPHSLPKGDNISKCRTFGTFLKLCGFFVMGYIVNRKI